MDYGELHLNSAFSFLEGVGLPEDLIHRAAELEIPSIALVDRNSLSGAPRFFKAARKAGIRPIVGAEIVLDEFRDSSQLRLLPDPPPPGTPLPRISLLVENPRGYGNLCRLLTEAARNHPKGRARASWDLLSTYQEGLYCLTGGAEGLLHQHLLYRGLDSARKSLERLHAIFPDRLGLELQRHHLRDEEYRNQALMEMASSLHLPIIATGGVRYPKRENKELADVLACIREGRNLENAGRLLDPHREAHLKTEREMRSLFSDMPRAVDEAGALAQRLNFDLSGLGYRFPDYPLPPGETSSSFLHQLTWREARSRFRPLSGRAQAQLEKELKLIEKLDLAGYFLIVWDIVRFCRQEKILAQGRGSAANSAVCYALSITAVDPVRMDLLFERFLSEERGEWPDIDLDLPSGAQREKVIQYVYSRYGPHGAAMTANVITYRDRSATRDIAKALGFSLEEAGALSRRLGGHASTEFREGQRSFDEELKALGFDPQARRWTHFKRLWWEIHHLPRHLGQHSGGMIIAHGRLDEVVPLEPAAMEGRTVIQWDKDDCADLGLIKVDLLGLGMLSALEEMIPLIREHEEIDLDLAHLPPNDPKTYRMIQKADTMGVFQIESRAQMASLPRNRPECFYDLVVQVAIIRPGPIAGKMTSPYLQRRMGREPIRYPHPSLEPVLKRTLGVPLFQEQLLRIAMVAAGFSGGQAEELRRAMGFKRSNEAMAALETDLRQGMQKRGIEGEAQEEILRSITSFALYGFPESHAASFALIVYASAYLKCHHPTAFFLGLLRAWPMGFYHPATLIKKAQRSGVRIFPVDISHSGWKSRWENGGIRLGLRWIKGLRKEFGETIEFEQARRFFSDAADLASRCCLSPEILERLAFAGALGSLGSGRRQTLWQVAEISGRNTPLFSGLAPEKDSPLPEMNSLEETLADYSSTHLTTGPHIVAHLRDEFSKRGARRLGELESLRDGQRVRTGGAVISRQRPSTAHGFVFLSLEDETGIAQVIIEPDLWRMHRNLIRTAPILLIEGRLQIRDGTLSIKADTFELIKTQIVIPSHDFH